MTGRAFEAPNLQLRVCVCLCMIGPALDGLSFVDGTLMSAGFKGI